MTRIIGGEAGGRRLVVPAGQDTRPTADRAREALFSALASMTDLAGARFLDLFAGSGAVGLEALSRGASEALLVESDPKAAAVLRANIDAVALPGARSLTRPVAAVLAQPPPAPFDVAFADPPYALPAPELAGLLALALAGGWLAADAVVVVERSTRDPGWVWPEGLVADRERAYGEATLWYARRESSSTPLEGSTGSGGH